MKKKILNDMKVVIIILIGVTILFAILGAFNISMKENMEDLDLSNESPQCFPNSVVDHDYASFNDRQDDDKYILKTKIVPPKGTACPTEISGPASKYLNKVDKGETTISSKSTVQELNSNTSNLTQNITNVSDNTPSPADSASSTPESLETDTNNPNQIKQSTQSTQSNNTTQTNKSNDSCPPCPACERCPEPAFDCKKVPNYRSPSIGQYLPMPILNDFSKF